MVDDKWHSADDKPKLYIVADTYFSDNLLIKVKEDTLKGYYYMVGYLNDTDKVWLNPLTEEEISDEILCWKYIE